MKTRFLIPTIGLILISLGACGGEPPSTSGSTTTTSTTSAGTGGGSTTTTSTTSAGTGGEGGSFTPMPISLSTCDAPASCNGSTPIAPYWLDLGTPYKEAGDWMSSGLVLPPGVTGADMNSALIFTAYVSVCKPLPSTVLVKVLPAAEKNPPLPNDPSVWDQTLTLPGTEETNMEIPFTTPIHLDNTHVLWIAVQMNATDPDHRLCVMANYTDDASTSRDLWLHTDANGPETCNPETCFIWKESQVSPTPQDGAAFHWNIGADGMTTAGQALRIISGTQASHAVSPQKPRGRGAIVGNTLH